jgi:methylated-DNA-[protein]-cysteine S-methyltransferase
MRKETALKELEKYDLTEFQKKVLIATLSIKKGETKTYKQIAEQIGKRKAYRAVGTALRLNPLAPTIPCHRVVKSDGSTGNYSGKGGPAGKVAMLKAEGAIN